MKKKILLSLLVVVALFTITGCSKSNKTTSSSNLHKNEFVDMRYNEPKNYSKKEKIYSDDKETSVFSVSSGYIFYLSSMRM
jgi:ABC-type oligopeptide transport system substrate-binding subunit